jgi:serine/threonine-protein kinase RsbW
VLHRTARLPSTLDAASTASDLLLEVAGAWDIPEAILEKMLLAVQEAVANAAEHGNALATDAEVVLTYALRDGEVAALVEDSGSGMQLSDIEGATLPDDPLDTSGRGLYIIRELAERVWLEAGGRRLGMAWRVDAAT